MRIKKAKYDEETRLATIYGRKFLKKNVITRYFVNPNHIYFCKTSMGVKAYAIVDVALRCSVSKNPKTLGALRNKIEGKSIILHSDTPINEKLKNKLDYMTERSFWQALMIKVRTPLLWVLIYMLSGMGFYSFIRMLLQAMGYHLP